MKTIRNTPPQFVKAKQPRSSMRRKQHPSPGHFALPEGQALTVAQAKYSGVALRMCDDCAKEPALDGLGLCASCVPF